ncbi:MAG TPA: SRPBCC family protein [Acidimicrobiales bacterium]|nr:SRPBCC family protein [Acidimicrobiales bacterium]
MTDRLATLERTESGGLIRFERVFPNPIEDVWSALTEPERLADWWPPFATNVRVDLREGGTMSFDWPDGPALEFRFLRISRPTLLEHTHTSPGSWMRYELAATADGTLLRATYFVPEPDEAIGRGDIVGGHYGFDRLQAALAGHPVPVDFEAFTALQRLYAEQGLASAQQG